MLSGIAKKARDLYWELTFLPTDKESDLEFQVNRWRGQLKEMIAKIEDVEAAGLVQGKDSQI